MLASGGTWILTAIALLGLAVVPGCDRSGSRAVTKREARRAAVSESAYHPAPTVLAVGRDEGRIVLSGSARPGVPVRLATPDGRVVSVVASRQGAWRFALPPSTDMRLYSLSMFDGGRVVQSEGYLAVATDVVAELRAGAGVLTYGVSGGGARIAAVDYDSKGGCVVSGTAAPGQLLAIRIDGVDRGAVRADDRGGFSLALDEPVLPGAHTVTLVAEGKQTSIAIDVTPAGPMPAIPLLAARTPRGWRVDWTTPGGGLQTSLLFVSSGSST